jgi:putative colanic acid biosynthesis UDP-glucose lipid carrier transferase
MYSKGYFKYFNALLLSFDLVLVLGAVKIGGKCNLFGNAEISNFNLSDFLFAWALSFYFFHSNFSNRIIALDKLIQNLFFQSVTATFLYFLLSTVDPNNSESIDLTKSFYILCVLFVFIFFVRFVEFILLQKYRSFGKNFVRVAFYKWNSGAEHLFHFMNENPQFGFKVIGIFNSAQIVENCNLLGDLASIPKNKIQSHQIDEVYCSVNLTDLNELAQLQQFCSDNYIKLRVVPEFSGVLSRKLDFEYFNNVLVIKLRPEPLENIGARFSKRFLDLAFSFLALVILIPIVFPLIALFIRLNSRGPILFKQERTGINEKTFMCFKFRTMTVENDNPSMQVTSGDARVTSVGKFLRKTSLDELPQFINVMLGQMSVVGPRPHMIEHTASYSEQIEHYMFRHSVRPGITGWAQIHGLRGNTSNIEQMKKRVELDAWYIENFSIYTDLKIIFRTALLVFRGDKNAY